MTKFVGVVLLVVMFASGDTRAAPHDDLGAASQATRDTAAEQLRATFKRVPRRKFDKLAKAIAKPGMTKPKVLALLKPYHATSEGGGAGGGGETILYRIDDGWILECAFSTRGDANVIGPPRLAESIRNVWVEPPKDFTGIWTTYFVNGQRSHEINYKHGAYAGAFTSFHDDGSKAVVQTYGHKGADGDDLGYHRNGKLAYRGRYEDGKQIGTWTWYDDTGKVTSTKQYP